MSVKITKCTDDEKKAIYKLKNTNEDHIKENVKIIQNWVKTQPHIPEIPETSVIATFLIIFNFNLEEVKKRLSFYYVIRSIIPDVFCVHPKHPAIISSMKSFDYLVLPDLTPDFDRVAVFRLNEEASDQFDPIACIAHMIFITEIRLREDLKRRDVLLYDVKHINVSHFTKLSPVVIKKIATITKKVYKDLDIFVNIINVAPFALSFINMIISLYPPNVQERFKIHNNLQSVYKVIPKEILPNEYGGNVGTVKELREMWEKKIEEYDPLFAHLRSLKIDNDLLPENLKIDDQFGVHGNFKKLDVD